MNRSIVEAPDINFDRQEGGAGKHAEDYQFLRDMKAEQVALFGPLLTKREMYNFRINIQKIFKKEEYKFLYSLHEEKNHSWSLFIKKILLEPKVVREPKSK
jgi:hypothetical protein